MLDRGMDRRIEEDRSGICWSTSKHNQKRGTGVTIVHSILSVVVVFGVSGRSKGCRARFAGICHE